LIQEIASPIDIFARLSDRSGESAMPPGILRAIRDGYSFSRCIKETSPPWMQVYRGVSPQGLVVAVKVPAVIGDGLDACVLQLADEARLLGDVVISGLASPIHFEESGIESYLVTKYAGDLHLLSHLRLSKLDGQQFHELMTRIIEIVSSLHSAGYTHGDLGASHIIIGDDHQPTLIDFGMSMPWRTDEPRGTRNYLLGGTPKYMAPELAQALAGDATRLVAPHPCQDVYSLGIILREAMEVAGLSSKQLERTAACAASSNPEDRYQDASEMLAALQPKVRRLWLGWTSGVAVMLAVTGVAGYVIYNRAPEAQTVHVVEVVDKGPMIVPEPHELLFRGDALGAGEMYLVRMDPQSKALVGVTASGHLVYRASPNIESSSHKLDAAVRAIDIAPGGEWAGLRMEDGSIAIYSPDCRLVSEIKLASPIHDFRFDASGEVLLCWSPETLTVSQIDLAGEILREYPVRADYLQWDTDDRGIFFGVLVTGVVGVDPVSIDVIDLDEGVLMSAVLPRPGHVTAADYSPSTGTLAVGSTAGAAHAMQDGVWYTVDLNAASKVLAIHADGWIGISGELTTVRWTTGAVTTRCGTRDILVTSMDLFLSSRSVIGVSAAGVQLWRLDLLSSDSRSHPDGASSSPRNTP